MAMIGMPWARTITTVSKTEMGRTGNPVMLETGNPVILHLQSRMAVLKTILANRG
jgi:hypothetical protein